MPKMTRFNAPTMAAFCAVTVSLMTPSSITCVAFMVGETCSVSRRPLKLHSAAPSVQHQQESEPILTEEEDYSKSIPINWMKNAFEEEDSLSLEDALVATVNSADIEHAAATASIVGTEVIQNLEAQMEYWQRDHDNHKNSYEHYIHHKMIENKLNPIYEREGKIDHYKLRPFHDQETHRLQSEIYQSQMRLKLVRAKLREERRVQQVRLETEQRATALNAKAQRQAQFKLEAAKRQLQRQAVAHTKEQSSLQAELGHAQERLEQVRSKAEARLVALKAEYNAVVESLQQESDRKLSDKQDKIDELSKEIHRAMVGLRRSQQKIDQMASTIRSLKSTIAEKDAEIEQLKREKNSLRALARQSFRVMKKRLQDCFMATGSTPPQQQQQQNRDDSVDLFCRVMAFA